AAHQFGARDQVAATRAAQFHHCPIEFHDRRARVALQVVGLEGIQRAVRIRLPFRRYRAAAARGQKKKSEQREKSQGNFTFVSRSKGHLRLTSSISDVTLRRLASTSARSTPRPAAGALAFVPTVCA